MARAAYNPVVRAFEALRRRLPEGAGLPEEAWQRRHRGILTLLWLHVPGVFLFGLTVGTHGPHLLLETLPIAVAAAAAAHFSHHKTLSTVLASAGLVTASAVLVHLSRGVIEVHFHFFVMVGVVVLYQNWWPFLVAFAYVVLHHGTVGTFAAHEVYNHAAALNNPWKWAAIHGLFILGMSTAGIVNWRLNESLRAAAVESEQHLAEAQQLAHVGSWEVDVGTGSVSSSEELKRLFGFTGDGQPTLEDFVARIHPDDRPRVMGAMAQGGETGAGFTLDFRVIPEPGRVRWVHGRGEGVVGETGTVRHIRGTTQDITERKQSEAALARESMVRQLLQTVAAAANEARTAHEAIEVAVEQVCRFTGWPVGHALFPTGAGKPLVSARVWYLEEPERFDAFRRASEEMEFDVGVGLPGRVWGSAAPAWIADLSADESFPRIGAAAEVGLRSAFAFPILINHDVAGVLEFFSTRHEPIDAQLLDVMAQVGKQLGLVLERTRAADALRVSEERNRTILETASDAFVGMDEQGLIVDWNQRAELMFGWPREEAIGRELAETVIPEDQREAHREGLRRYLRTGSGPVVGGRLTFEALRRDATRFPVELAVWEVRSPSGCQFNAFVRDITHQKQAEEALASARDHALEASRLKSEFLANMSHEIRTPMNGVIGLTNLLLDTRLDGTQRSYAEGIRSAGDALLGIINDILDFSKAEAGKIELEELDFDLQELVEEGTSLLAGAAAAKGLELVTDCDSNLPAVVRGDPGRLRQVLVNLVGNAVKFTERGEVIVRARLADEGGDHVTVRFEVADTGIGIDPASRDRVFGSFTQADASTTRRYGGTGLGLALSKRLVELMGGQIGVESDRGAGSTFWFSVPLARQPGTPAQRPLPPRAPSLVDVRALVVDDNASNRLILEEQLSNWGMRPDAVADPRQALHLARVAAAAGEPYDVALLDVQMPEMTGLELAEAIGGEPELGHPPVILLSSVDALPQAQGAGNGVRASLLKPVRQSELLDALLDVLAPVGKGEYPTGGDREHGEQGQAWRGHVLVVEDNAVNRMVALGTLAKLGCSADVATNGREAVEAVSRRPYAAVLMDCQMPEMDGYQATQEIRRREDRDRRVPIIAMTASAMAGDRERCLAAGMDDHIPKPVRVEELDAALARWTGSTLTSSAGSGAEPDPDEVLDRSQLDELRNLGAGTGGGNLFAELVSVFAQQTTARLAELRAAARIQDSEALARLAHTVKGSSAALGARRAASAAAALEEAVRAGDFSEVAARLQVLEEELQSATRELLSQSGPS
ncbi:MAG TPA: response regulator [Acidimicrobiales bacterium]|nr:response regulator [Acidimicrobiales bacterium]